MSQKYPGGLITKSPVTPSGPYETSTASGIWTLDQQAYWRNLNQWPIAGSVVPDPQFNYVTMLLHGDGTNGAQNNTFLDSSTNNFTITRNGNTTQGSFSPYGSNWSNYFDGSGDYLSVPDNAALEGFTNFTFECWVNVSDFSSGDCIFAKGWTPGGFTPYMFYFTSTDLVFYASSSLSGWDVASGEVIVSNIVKNQWYHVAASRSGSSIKLFANGAVTTSFTGGSTLGTNAGAFTIGASLSGDRDPTMYVSNLRINNTALYTAAFTPSTTPLTAVSGTALLTCADSRFIDDSTNNFTLTPNGTPSVQRFNPFGTATAYSTGVIGGSGYFDGSGDYLTVASNTAFAFGTGNFTWEAWAYVNTNGTQALYNTNIADGFIINNNSGTITVRQFGVANLINSAITINVKTWTHIAVARSGTTLSLWINGSRSDGGTATNSTNFTQNGLLIGVNDIGGGFFDGYLSNLRVVKGTAVYDPTQTTITVPTAPVTAITNTSLLTNFTNGAIFDNAMMNDLETVGNAQISTSVVKYGTGSLYFDGTGDYLIAPNNPAYLFNTGDFTVELFYYPTVLAGAPAYNQHLVGMWGGVTSQASWLLYYSLGNLYWYTSTNGSAQVASITAAVTLSINNWYHLALVRSSGTTTIYLNGTSVGSTATVVNLFNANCALTVGYNPIGGTPDYLYGYIDELRITKGYARYTATFTPPTAAFPNIGPT